MRIVGIILAAILAVILGILSVPSDAAEADEAERIVKDITTDCTTEWPGDYTMIEWCRDQQIEAITKLVVLVPEPESDPVLVSCVGEWSDEKRVTPDYVMILWCYEQQTGAKSRLGM